MCPNRSFLCPDGSILCPTHHSMARGLWQCCATGDLLLVLLVSCSLLCKLGLAQYSRQGGGFRGFRGELWVVHNLGVRNELLNPRVVLCELTSPCGSNSPSFEVLRPQRINQWCEMQSLQHPLIISPPSLPLDLPEVAFKVSRTPCYPTGQELCAPAQSCSCAPQPVPCSLV